MPDDPTGPDPRGTQVKVVIATVLLVVVVAVVIVALTDGGGTATTTTRSTVAMTTLTCVPLVSVPVGSSGMPTSWSSGAAPAREPTGAGVRPCQYAVSGFRGGCDL